MKLLTPESRLKFLEGALAGGDEIPAQTYEIKKPIQTSILNGCGSAWGKGPKSYDCPPHAMRGKITEIVQLGRGPVLRVRGSGLTWENCPARLVANGIDPCIEIEGRGTVPMAGYPNGTGPATGWHVFRNLTFANSPLGVRALNGFYEGDKFVKYELHADNCKFENCFYATTKVFEDNNEQAVVWKFRDCVLGPILPGYPPANGEDCIADLRRGGDIHLGFEVLRPTALIARVRDYSPHSPKITLDIAQDHFAASPYHLSILDYTGPIWTNSDGKPTGPLWALEGSVLIRGYAGQTPMVFDDTRYFTGDAARLPIDLWKLRVINMGKTNPLTEYGP